MKQVNIILISQKKEEANKLIELIDPAAAKVNSFSSIKEAHSHAAASGVDLAIMINPDDNHIKESFKNLCSRETTSDCYKIIITNSENEKDMLEKLNLGFDDFLFIDSGPDLIKAKLEAIIRRRQVQITLHAKLFEKFMESRNSQNILKLQLEEKDIKIASLQKEFRHLLHDKARSQKEAKNLPPPRNPY